MWLLAKNLEFEKRSISINGKKFSAMIADTMRKQAVGLMFKEKLNQNECMLFIFRRPSRYSIIMRNMKFPIDVLWLGENKKTVDTISGIKPSNDFSTYKPVGPALYVIELKEGTIKREKITKDSKIRF